MARRRGKGAGTVYEDKVRGGWVGQVDLGFNANGKRIRKSVRGKTRKEVELAIASLVTQHNKGIIIKPERVTLGGYLDRWLGHQEGKVKYTTWTSYDGAWVHLKRHLGVVELGKLQPLQVQEFITRMRKETYKAGRQTKPYTERTVQRAFGVLKMALDQAVEWGLISFNPAKRVDPPAPKARKEQVWTTEQTHAFFERIQGHHFEAAFHLAARTGMRLGEVNGLK